MGLVSRFRGAILLGALAACALPALAQSDPWQSHLDYMEGRAKINGILLRQDIERVRKGQPSTAAMRNFPTVNYPMPKQGAGSGALTARPNGDVEVARGIRGTGPASQVIDVEVREVYPRAKIARRIVESLPLVGSAVGGALLIKDLIDAARIMEGPGGTILMDQGGPEVTETMWRYHRINAGSPYNNLDSGYVFRNEGDARDGALAHCEAASGITFCVVESDTTSTRWVGSYRCGSSSDGMTADACVQAHPGGPGYMGAHYYTIQSSSVLTCPEGQSVSFWAEDWCTTSAQDWEVVDVDTGADRIDTRMGLYPGQTPDLLRELDDKGIGVGTGTPSVQGPASVHSGRETTNNPDGSTTVKDTSHDIRYGPQEASDGTIWPGWDWNTREEVRTYPPGEPVPEPGADPAPPNGGGTVTEGPGGSGLEDLITCGLPWTPPCKIDETGTPQAPPDTADADADGVISGLRACLTSPAACLPALPDLSWSFALPEGCTPLELAGFDMTLDVCQFQPILHDLLSMLWVAAGLFGAVAMVSREAMGGGT